MSKVVPLVVLVGAVAGGWYFFSHYRIAGLENLKVQPRKSGQEAVEPAGPAKKTITLASANFSPLDAAKLAKPGSLAAIVKIVRQYDLIALQDIQARDQSVLVQLVEQVNAQGRHYDFAVPPSVGRDPLKSYCGVLFDADTLEIDRGAVMSVDNRQGQFRHPPMIAAFRARGPAAKEAFTFTLIVVHTPPDRAEQELGLLASVYRRVRDDGRNEDDVILAGDLSADDEHLGPLGAVANVTCAITGVPTTTRGTRLVDNLLFNRLATVEFTGRSGVFDLVRELDLNQNQAIEISEHLPVWAEFNVYEGGQAGQVSR